MLAAVLTVSDRGCPAVAPVVVALLLAFVPIHLVVSADRCRPARLLGLAVGWFVER